MKAVTWETDQGLSQCSRSDPHAWSGLDSNDDDDVISPKPQNITDKNSQSPPPQVGKDNGSFGFVGFIYLMLIYGKKIHREETTVLGKSSLLTGRNPGQDQGRKKGGKAFLRRIVPPPCFQYSYRRYCLAVFRAAL